MMGTLLGTARDLKHRCVPACATVYGVVARAHEVGFLEKPAHPNNKWYLSRVLMNCTRDDKACLQFSKE